MLFNRFKKNGRKFRNEPVEGDRGDPFEAIRHIGIKQETTFPFG